MNNCLAIVIGLSLLLFANRTCIAQSCENTPFINTDTRESTRADILARVSKQLGKSILYEASFQSKEADLVSIPGRSSSMSLRELISLLSPGRTMDCQIKGKLILIDDPLVASPLINPLSHVFTEFNVPRTPDAFAIAFRSRVVAEALLPQRDEYRSGSTGGAYSSKQSSAQLKEQIIQGKTAREIYSAAATQVTMVLYLELQQNHGQSPGEDWVQSSRMFKLIVTQD